VGVGFDETGDRALVEAIHIGREHPNDELHAVHVVDTGATHDAQKLAELADLAAAARVKLRERVMQIVEAMYPGEAWEQQFVLHVRIGDTAKALEQVAVDVDADLLVVGTHGRRGVEKFFLGSVAETLMKKAHLPVLVARPKNFDGLEKSPHAEPPRPGQSLRPDGTWHHSEIIRFGSRSSHVSGLI
jgi:nucleotide-binding universal stress UspA family protein